MCGKQEKGVATFYKSITPIKPESRQNHAKEEDATEN